MRLFLSITFALSAAGSALALFRPGWSDLLLISAPVAIASAVLWLLQARQPAPPAPVDPAKQLVVDGSNVMYWRDNTPRLETVVELLDLLHGKGYTVGIIFDASAGHVLFGRYLDDRHFAQRLGLPDAQCFVVPKGTIADEYILRAARELGARVVTNDRYRDWARDFPEVAKPGQLIRGRIEKNQIKLHRLAPPRRTTA